MSNKNYPNLAPPVNVVPADELNEMLGRTPSRVMRWGSFSIIGVILLLIAVAASIQYPDTLEGKAIITTSPSPLHFKAMTGGRLVNLFAKEGELVHQNAAIAEFQNNVGYSNVKQLEAVIKNVTHYLSTNDNSGLSDVFRNRLNPVGAAQPYYNALLQSINRYFLLKVNMSELTDKFHFKSQSDSLTSLDLHFENAELDFMRNEKLNERLNAALSVFESLRTLENYLQNWKLQFLLTAPFEGTIYFQRNVEANQLISAGNDVFTLVPAKYRCIAQVTLPSSGFGKIKLGQQVDLSMDQYPHLDFGYVEGHINRIFLIPEMIEANNGSNLNYNVEVALPDSLVTTFHHNLRFNPEMPATARIITKDRTLLQRLVNGK